MPDIGRLRVETGRAIGKIEAPAANEFFVESQRPDFGRTPVERVQPALQRFTVIAAEAVRAHELQPRRGGVREQPRRRGEHTTRENVLLDEVRLRPIAREAFLGNRDRLDARAAAGNEGAPDRAEIRRPPTLAHGLDHLDRGDAVIRFADVAIVLQPKLHAFGDTALRDALACVGGLRVRQRNAGDAPPGGRGVRRETAPAAADFENVRVAAARDFREHARVFRALRDFERQVAAAVEQRCRIGHRRIEPEAVERVAEVVVRDDVLACAAPGVRAQQVAQTQERAHPGAAVEDAFERRLVGREHRQELRQVGRVPAAVDVGFGKRDIAAVQRIGGDLPVVKRDDCGRGGSTRRSGATGTELAGDAVGGREHERAALHPFEQCLRDAQRRRRAAGSGRACRHDGGGADEATLGRARVHSHSRVSGWIGGAGLAKNGTRLPHRWSACQ